MTSRFIGVVKMLRGAGAQVLQRVAGGARLAVRMPIRVEVVRVIGRGQLRALGTGLWHSNGLRRINYTRTLGRRTAAAWAEATGLNVSFAAISGAFLARRTSDADSSAAFPQSLDGYELGSHIDKGCHAAVYEARLRSPLEALRERRQELWDLNSVHRLSDDSSTSTDPPGIRHRNNVAVRRQQAELCQRLGDFPLALKLLFNYGYGSTDEAILRSASRELVPATRGELQRLLRRHVPVPHRSPFLVLLHAAFVDEMPVLAGAEQLYPAALPAHPLFEGRFGAERTLMVVMKRYTMTLTAYLRQYYYSTRIGTVLTGQLWEGLNFLAESGIAHRDLKSNNLLLDFEDADEAPHLVISDFGCCLSKGGEMECAAEDAGGNPQLQPPEIATALGPRLDFAKADAWAGGTLAYEIYSRCNPFYQLLSSASYDEREIPPLPSSVPTPIARVIAALLRRDPAQRCSAATAATAAAVALFRGGSALSDAVSEAGEWSRGRWERLREGLQLYAAETILGGLELAGRERGYFASAEALSGAELELRSSFLQRADRDKSHFLRLAPFFAAPNS